MIGDAKLGRFRATWDALRWWHGVRTAACAAHPSDPGASTAQRRPSLRICLQPMCSMPNRREDNDAMGAVSAVWCAGASYIQTEHPQDQACRHWATVAASNGSLRVAEELIWASAAALSRPQCEVDDGGSARRDQRLLFPSRPSAMQAFAASGAPRRRPARRARCLLFLRLRIQGLAGDSACAPRPRPRRPCETIKRAPCRRGRGRARRRVSLTARARSQARGAG